MRVINMILAMCPELIFVGIGVFYSLHENPAAAVGWYVMARVAYLDRKISLL